MNLSIGNFKDAIGKETWQSADIDKTNGQKAPEIKVSDLKPVDENAQDKATSGIFRKEQILGTIHNSLVASEQTTVSQEGDKDIVTYGKNATGQVQDFLEGAEKALFGAKPGNDKAGQDPLENKTVNELVTRRTASSIRKMTGRFATS